MIVYFTATGNSEYIANKIGKATDDIVLPMTDIANITLLDGEPLGIVSPVYFLGLPSYVEDFIRCVGISNSENSYVYFVATYGDTAGQADFYMKKLLMQKGVKLNAGYGIRTVDNWTVLFGVNDKGVIDEALAAEEQKTAAVIEQIKARAEVSIPKEVKKSRFLCAGAAYFYEKARKTSHLHVNDDCIGCGICERDCPVEAIKLVDGKPTWVKKSCTMCFRCLHRCPKFAIHYDDKTQGKGQYVHP